MQKTREKTQMINIRNEHKNINNDFRDINKIRRTLLWTIMKHFMLIILTI